MRSSRDVWDVTRAPELEPSEWEAAGETMSIDLFGRMVERVPAYSKFLKAAGVSPTKIKTAADLRKLPVMTKENYLRRYPMHELMWDGKLSSGYSISVSSGSTGQPYFWPQGPATLKAGAYYYEMIMRQMFQAHERSTLVINCYALGTWIAGVFTNMALSQLSLRPDNSLPIVLTSPGLNIEEALRIAQEMGPNFEQIVMIGYGPFLKDIIDTGAQRGIDWAKFKLKLTFAGEPFNETWRQYMLEVIGATSPLTDMVGAYAACDAAFMGVETAAATQSRLNVMHDPELAEDLYGLEPGHGNRRVPTLQQFNPAIRNFDTTEDGYLLLSGDGAIPLMRYNFLDQGGVLSFDEVVAAQPELLTSLKSAKQPIITMPFVYVYGRGHNSATLYAVTIWPENIRAGIERPAIRDWLSGKHKMATAYTDKQDPYLEVTLEMAVNQDLVGLTEAQRKLIQTEIIAALTENNLEYRELLRTMGSRVDPVIILLPYGDATFKPGAKLARAEVIKA